jgi:CheY-like chemotaxis protein
MTERAVQQLADISRDLLALGRRAHTSLQPTDLNRVVEQAIEQLRDIPGTLRVEAGLSPDTSPVAGSSAQLLRVVANLLSNAREAMHDRGRLMVSTERVRIESSPSRDRRIKPGDYLRLSVSDSGTGIPPEALDRIFDPFFSTKTIGERRGSGLGLNIVRTVVEDHRGFVDVETELGRGTTFHVFLPVWEDGLSNPAGDGPRGTERILLLDDDRLHREVVRGKLEELGYQVECVSTGEHAVAAIAERAADLVILEMFTISGMDGVETYRRILEIRPQQRAIMISGLPETQWIKDGRAMGAGAFLRKPVHPADLARAVREEIDRAER